MPSTSDRQQRFMGAVANNSAFAKKVGVPQSVGRGFMAEDEGRVPSRRGGSGGFGKLAVRRTM